MRRVLVVNHAHSAVCGIHDLGRRMYERLRWSRTLEAGYAECRSTEEYHSVTAGYDVVIVNYRADLMPWVPFDHPGHVRFGIMHNYDAEETSVFRAVGHLLSAGMDYAMALEPLLPFEHGRMVKVGRPWPKLSWGTPPSWPIRVGSFGFAFPHKGFGSVAEAIVDADLPAATYALHMPEAFFNGANGAPIYTGGIVDGITSVFAGRQGHRLSLSTAHSTTDEVVEKLSKNHVNCLLYAPGQPDAGLSSALDYLVAAQRPILVSEAGMFRHAAEVCDVWPATSLRDILGDLQAKRDRVAQFAVSREYDFRHDIETLVEVL